MLQNATPLGKSAPWPPNISHEHVFCIAPATENASLQILFKRPTPAIVFGNATKPSRFAHNWQGARSLARATRNDTWTSKSGANMWCFAHFDFETCFAPQRHALFRHLNFQKWSENGVLYTFWLRNVLRATTACTFSTSQLPKVVRRWGALYILTSKCASRHNGVHFFISHLARWLRTRRFSEPTFRPSRATNHWKNTMFRGFPTFSRICIFFLLTLSLLWSALFYSSLLCASAQLCFSSVHIVGSLTSKFPSTIWLVHVGSSKRRTVYYVKLYLFMQVTYSSCFCCLVVAWLEMHLRLQPPTWKWEPTCFDCWAGRAHSCLSSTISKANECVTFCEGMTRAWGFGMVWTRLHVTWLTLADSSFNPHVCSYYIFDLSSIVIPTQSREVSRWHHVEQLLQTTLWA